MTVKKGFLVMMAVAALVASAACKNEHSASDTATAAEGTAGAATATTITSPAGPAPADQRAPAVAAGESRYLTQALERGMGQIELAQLVSRRSDSDAVDALAREIIAAHNEVNAELARIAAGTSVTLPADAAAELRQTIARMEGLDGRNLDAAYLAAMLQMYPDLVNLHHVAATTATNMAVKDVAVRARALFETNLRQARAAYAQVTGVVPALTPEAGSPPPAQANPTST